MGLGLAGDTVDTVDIADLLARPIRSYSWQRLLVEHSYVVLGTMLGSPKDGTVDCYASVGGLAE